MKVIFLSLFAFASGMFFSGSRDVYAANKAACIKDNKVLCISGNTQTVAACKTAPECISVKDTCLEVEESRCGKAAEDNENNNISDIDCKKNPDACLYNPLPTDSLLTMFLLILRGFLYMTGIVSVIFIVVGGFKMVVAQGNEESYESARKTITWAIMGLVVALLSFSIVAIVQYILGASLPLVGS